MVAWLCAEARSVRCRLFTSSQTCMRKFSWHVAFVWAWNSYIGTCLHVATITTHLEREKEMSGALPVWIRWENAVSFCKGKSLLTPTYWNISPYSINVMDEHPGHCCPGGLWTDTRMFSSQQGDLETGTEDFVHCPTGLIQKWIRIHISGISIVLFILKSTSAISGETRALQFLVQFLSWKDTNHLLGFMPSRVLLLKYFIFPFGGIWVRPVTVELELCRWTRPLGSWVRCNCKWINQHM